MGHCIHFRLLNLLTYLSNWAYLLTISFTLSSLLLARAHSSVLGEIRQISFTLGLFFNLVTVVGYWTIHSWVINEFRGYTRFHCYTCHSLPQIGFVLTWYCDKGDLTLKPDGARLLLAASLVYCGVNYLETQRLGEPIYFCLTWSDYTSFVGCAAVILVMQVSYAPIQRRIVAFLI